jgi:hypothetical protein
MKKTTDELLAMGHKEILEYVESDGFVSVPVNEEATERVWREIEEKLRAERDWDELDRLHNRAFWRTLLLGFFIGILLTLLAITFIAIK